MPLTEIMLDPRRAPREPVTMPCSVSAVALLVTSATVLNISPYGAMVRSNAQLEQGQSLTITVPVIGSLNGKVIWSTKSAFGMEFIGSISLADYVLLMSKVKKLADRSGQDRRT